MKKRHFQSKDLIFWPPPLQNRRTISIKRGDLRRSHIDEKSGGFHLDLEPDKQRPANREPHSRHPEAYFKLTK